MGRSPRESEAKMMFINFEIDEKTGCWNWKRGISGRGYGYAHLYKTENKTFTIGAHRLAYRLAKGKLITGLRIMHSCDNPRCVNPAHLSQGTNIDNMQDCCRKGRIAKGENTGNSKFTADIVRAMRQLFAQGNITKHDVSRRFGVSVAQGSKIINRKAWRHIE